MALPSVATAVFYFPSSPPPLHHNLTAMEVLVLGIKWTNRDELFSSPFYKVFIIYAVAALFSTEDMVNVPEQNSSGATVNGNHYIRWSSRGALFVTSVRWTAAALKGWPSWKQRNTSASKSYLREWLHTYIWDTVFVIFFLCRSLIQRCFFKKCYDGCRTRILHNKQILHRIR